MPKAAMLDANGVVAGDEHQVVGLKLFKNKVS
jgi:hypothetical protein